MPAEIEKAYINQFHAGFETAFQQTRARFRGSVIEGRQSAEFDYYDRVGIAEDMKENNTRYGDNPMSEIPHDRRRIHVKDWDNGKAIDEKDLKRVATDPTNEYTQALVYSANRKYDDNVIATAFGTAYTGKAGETQVAFVGTTSGKVTVGAVSNTLSRISTAGRYTLTAGNYEGIDIAKDYTGGAAADAGITLAKLKAVRTAFKLLAEDYVTDTTLIDCWITAYQAEQLLSITEIINSDYATKKALAEGDVASFMGFRFRQSERLTKTSGVRECICMMPRAIRMALSVDISADMWRLPAKKNIPYIYVKMGMGGSRMWGECIAKLNCVET